MKDLMKRLRTATVVVFAMAQAALIPLAPTTAAMQLGAIVVAGTTLVASEAEARAGFRVCLSPDKKTWAMVRESPGCTWVTRHSKFQGGTTLKLTCEEYAKTYTKWEWDPCYGAPVSEYDGDWPLSTAGVKPLIVSDFPKDGNWKQGLLCGAALCGISVNWSKDESYSISPSGALSGLGITYTNTTTYTAGGAANCTWRRGEVPWLQLRNMTNKTNITQLATSLYCGTQGVADEETNKQKVWGSNVEGSTTCPAAGTYKWYNGKKYLVGALSQPTTAATTYANALQVYDFYKPMIDGRNSALFGVNGQYRYACKVNLAVSISSGIREGASVGYTWKTQYWYHPLTPA